MTPSALPSAAIDGEPSNLRPTLLQRAGSLACTCWVDKTVAVGWVAYNIHALTRWRGRGDLFNLTLVVAMVPIHNILLLFRRSPRRFAVHPLFWIVGFLAGNW